LVAFEPSATDREPTLACLTAADGLLFPFRSLASRPYLWRHGRAFLVPPNLLRLVRQPRLERAATSACPAGGNARRALDPARRADHGRDGAIVGEDRRFADAERWLRERLAAARLKPAVIEAAGTRQDRGVAVPGLIVVAQKG
jgi:hypothetical protein